MLTIWGYCSDDLQDAANLDHLHEVCCWDKLLETDLSGQLRRRQLVR